MNDNDNLCIGSEDFDQNRIQSMLRHIDDTRVRALAEFAMMTGLRDSELKKLRWADIDLMNATIRIPVTNPSSDVVRRDGKG